MFLRGVLAVSVLVLTACGKGGDGGNVTINPPPDVCVESSLGLFKGKHNGWCQLDNPHYDPAVCEETNPPVVDDPGEDAEETECPAI
jgi:hypothetical protein